MVKSIQNITFGNPSRVKPSPPPPTTEWPNSPPPIWSGGKGGGGEINHLFIHTHPTPPTWYFHNQDCTQVYSVNLPAITFGCDTGHVHCALYTISFEYFLNFLASYSAQSDYFWSWYVSGIRMLLFSMSPIRIRQNFVYQDFYQENCLNLSIFF